MNIYHIWAELKSGVSDMEFVKSINDFLGPLKTKGQVESYRITRRKLGLGIEELLDFHIMIEFRDLAGLDQTFGNVAARTEPVESLHHAVNSKVNRVRFALYRDFPDDVRTVGQEKF